ncbi:hypothetical protein ACE193_25340 (plasmid) [Bernardetia sp. OM2101]|uniref:hypothetical protein n=1 Tax=Bernardetia sp. OM2101 TaxID=3344876 RepID=UPI0035CEFE2E
MNFFNIIKKGTNTQLESLKDSAIYDIAAEKLEPKPYATQAKPLFLLSKYFSVAYHFISYIVALIGIILYSMQLDSIIYQIILIFLAFILLFVIEIAKGNSSNNVFSSTARKEQPNQLFLAILVITTIFSFCTSVWSAKEAVYYASTDTKFSNIDSLQNSQIDSVNNLFATQISSTESSIKASQNVLQSTKTNWKINTAQKDLKESQTTLTDILEKKEKALLSISKNIESKKSSTGDKGLFIAKLAAVIFLLFESLNLVCYWFLYQYYQSCLLENNLENEQPSEQPKQQTQIDIESITDALIKAITNTTQSVTSSVIPNPFIPNPAPTFEKKTIGFQFGNENRNEVCNDTSPILSDGNRICKNCGNAFIYKTSNHKFCSTECRINNWNKVNGKNFIVGQKGGKNA